MWPPSASRSKAPKPGPPHALGDVGERPGTEPTTSALSHGETFQHSVPIRVTAYYILLGGSALFAWLGVAPLPVKQMLGVTLAETLVLAALYRRAVSSSRWAGVYLGIEGICQTALFHLIGHLRIAVAPVVYIFELLNPGVRLGRKGHYIVANAFVALFAALVLAEGAGISRGRPIPGLVLSPQLANASLIIVFLSLNVAAFFISEARQVFEARTLDLIFAKQSLRNYSAQLEARVKERTSQLEESYRALQATRKALEEKAAALEGETHALEEKQEELRAFVYTVTHDLKNPLSAILLSADLLLERLGGSLDAGEREDLERIVRLAARTEEMIEGLLGLFRITSAPEPPSWVDLEAVVGRALESLGPQIARKGVRVEVGPLPRVWGQEEKLTHVVENLLGNAVKYVPEGGRGEVEVRGELGNREVLLCVRDNGVGIPAAYHERIFDLFRQVPEEEQGLAGGVAAGGTGVGLAVVRRVVEEHGGRVWVESAPGDGSRFYVRLPARESEQGNGGER